MARLRVFISSTYYDLKHLRESLSQFVFNQGYEPIQFERGHISYGKKESPEMYCYKEIESSDILVSIIGGKYGSSAQTGDYSITQKELHQALSSGKQVYIFIDKSVRSEYDTYKANKRNLKIKYTHVDNPRIYQFIDEIYELPRNNPIFCFEYPQEIIDILREQWSGLFQRLLHEELEKNKYDLIDKLQGTITSLEGVISTILEKQDESHKNLHDIMIYTHPSFNRIKKLLSIRHRILFTNISELSELLKAKGYVAVPEEAWDSPESFEWLSPRTSPNYLLKISKKLFDEKNNLTPISRISWDDNLISHEIYEEDDDDDDDDDDEISDQKS